MLHCNKLEEALNPKAYALAPDNAHAGAVLSASLPCTDGLRSEGQAAPLATTWTSQPSSMDLVGACIPCSNYMRQLTDLGG
jgi:hypothetical protein